jgi:hypothetical protein
MMETPEAPETPAPDTGTEEGGGDEGGQEGDEAEAARRAPDRPIHRVS